MLVFTQQERACPVRLWGLEILAPAATRGSKLGYGGEGVGRKEGRKTEEGLGLYGDYHILNVVFVLKFLQTG